MKEKWKRNTREIMFWYKENGKETGERGEEEEVEREEQKNLMERKESEMEMAIENVKEKGERGELETEEEKEQ